MAGLPRVWYALIALRLLWGPVLPQYGYIHPDEFFQSAEIVAGDVLGLDVFQPWEFNSSFPIRSIAFPYAMTALPFYALKTLNNLPMFDGYNIINTTTLLHLPRLFLTIVGLLMDFFVYNICKDIDLDPTVPMLLYASSYVTLIYYCRTFSNTVESFLFVGLLYAVISSLKCRETTRMESRYKTQKKKNEDKLKISGGNVSHLKSKQSIYTSFIAITVVAGVWNRPTFIAFAFVPCLFWLFCDDQFRWTISSVFQTINKITKAIPFAALTGLACILLDSAYYGKLTMQDVQDIVQEDAFSLEMWQKLFKILTVTPWNFIRYNTIGSNLAQHGLHPRYTHFLVNTGILFGLLAICGVYGLVFLRETFLTLGKGKYFKMLILSYYVPILLLSVFPHQEPRFLIPLLTPLCLFVSVWVTKRYTVLFTVVWILFNGFGGIMFGSLHQGGLIPALSYLQEQNIAMDGTKHIIFYHTYMPPQYLLNIPNAMKLRLDNEPSQRTYVHDLAGANVSVLFEKVRHTSQETKAGRMYLVSPASTCLSICQNLIGFELKLVQRFTPHLSFEDPPDFDAVFGCKENSINCNICCRRTSVLDRIIDGFGLNIYEINY